MLTDEAKVLCHLFADVLDYPTPALSRVATDCAREMERSYPGAAGPLGAYADFVKAQSQEALEELYTRTFDVTPATTLYFGHHLFGETQRRSVFLVRLQEAYQACSFSSGTELADHLGVILRFLSVTEDTEFARPLVEECLLPTLGKMEGELKKNGNEYAQVIGPLRAFIQQASRKLAKTGGVQHG